ncbi:MAG: rane protein [Flavipsychrobacter sp.]|jgi:CBS-domain-containing membrane protein|nr:rane protein [Flavipsychrobacter sp.]
MISKNNDRRPGESRYFIFKETLTNSQEHFWSFAGSFVAIAIIAYLQTKIHLSEYENIFLIGSFGASSVLVYGVIQSPFSQPRNLIGGHLVGAVVGVTVAKILPDIIWLTAPLAVSVAIMLMRVTKTIHPPGGATALIAVTGSAKIKSLGYVFVLFPVLTGAVIMLVVGLVFNNMTKDRKYPADERFTKTINRMLFMRRARVRVAAIRGQRRKMNQVRVAEAVEE